MLGCSYITPAISRLVALEWKTAHVSPIPKTSETSNSANYHPISFCVPLAGQSDFLCDISATMGIATDSLWMLIPGRSLEC